MLPIKKKKGEENILCSAYSLLTLSVSTKFPIDSVLLFMYFEYMKRYIFILLLLTFAFSSPARSADTEYIGIIPFYAPEKMWTLYLPLIDYLNKTTNITWGLKLQKNIEETVNAVCKGDISIAFLGPIPISKAQKKCGARLLLVALATDQKPYFHSVLVTSDSSVKSLSDLKGKEFGFIEGSTISYVLARKMLEDEGITMEMIRPVFFKGQDKIMEALMKHEIAAAGVKESLFRRFKGKQIKELKTSEPAPNFAFCASALLGRKVEKQFVQALLKVRPLTKPADKKLVERWDDEIKNGFILPPKDYGDQALKLLDLMQKQGK